MASNNVTADQILKHREMRKKSGMVGCITGRPTPSVDFYGFRDVQIWNTDASGRMNGSEGFDRKNPGCFCFDHRSAFDPRAEVDTELVNSGHPRACEVYASLLPKRSPAPSPAPAPAPAPSPVPEVVLAQPALALPQRAMTHYPGVLSCEEGCWCGYWERKKMACGGGGGADGGGSPLPQRTMTEHPEAYARGVPRSVWFPSPPPTPPMAALPPALEVPPLSATNLRISLPAPRHRDILNETRETRIKKDLLELLMDLRAEMITIMDHRRNAVYREGEERAAFLEHWEKKENEQWEKIRAAELLIHALDA